MNTSDEMIEIIPIRSGMTGSWGSSFRTPDLPPSLIRVVQYVPPVDSSFLRQYRIQFGPAEGQIPEELTVRFLYPSDVILNKVSAALLLVARHRVMNLRTSRYEPSTIVAGYGFSAQLTQIGSVSLINARGLVITPYIPPDPNSGLCRIVAEKDTSNLASQVLMAAEAYFRAISSLSTRKTSLTGTVNERPGEVHLYLPV